MPIRRPKDHPDAWWHVTNRGIAKRAAFECGLDMEQFLGLLAGQARLGRIEVHAYAVLTTHVHLLLRSPRGELPAAMQALFRGYVGWFNRSRKRDGALFRGRYKARRIEDWTYWENALRYIDLNPVRAGLCDAPSNYAYGSACHYAASERPDWLATSVVEGIVGDGEHDTRFRPHRYDEFALVADPDLLAQVVEPRLNRRSHAATVPLDDLIRSASQRQQRWFEWKARLADGTRPGATLIPPSLLARLLDRLPPELRHDRDLRSGLLRRLAGLSFTEIARRLSCSVSTAQVATARHDERCHSDAAYRTVVARVVDLSLRRMVHVLEGGRRATRRRRRRMTRALVQGQPVTS